MIPSDYERPEIVEAGFFRTDTGYRQTGPLEPEGYFPLNPVTWY